MFVYNGQQRIKEKIISGEMNEKQKKRGMIIITSTFVLLIRRTK